jgi:hypothetical protein
MESHLTLFAIAQLVACLQMVWVTNVQFPVSLFLIMLYRTTLASRIYIDFTSSHFCSFYTFVFYPVHFITRYIKNVLWILLCSSIIYYFQS